LRKFCAIDTGCILNISMILTDILGIILNAGLLIGLAFVYYKFTRRIKQFVLPPGPEIPSELAQYTDLIAQVMISRAMVSLKGHDMNAKSLEVRQANAVNKAVVKDTLAAVNPLLGLLANQYPNLVKTIAKNQELIPYALELAAKLQQGGNNGHKDIEGLPLYQENV